MRFGALRELRGFTAVVILTLTLGIGITTAMFSIVEAVLLNPLPYKNPDQLVVVWQKFKQHPEKPPFFDSYRDFELWQKNTRSFEQLAPATWATSGAILTGSGQPARCSRCRWALICSLFSAYPHKRDERFGLTICGVEVRWY